MRLHGYDLPIVRHRDDACRFLQRHGLDPHHTSWVEYDVIDQPLLRVCIYLTNDRGNHYADDDGMTATKTVEVPLQGELPEWWPR